MTVTFVGKNAMLEALGVDKALLAQMKQAGLTFSNGYKAFSIHSSSGQPLAVGQFDQPSHTYQNGKCPAHVKATAANEVNKAIKKCLGLVPVNVGVDISAGKDFSSTTVTPGDTINSALADTLAKSISDSMDSSLFATIANELTNELAAAGVGEVIPLRKATKMYQRVHGTSGSSVYVVVAMDKDASIAIAARVHGQTLSIRVEPIKSNSIPSKYLSSLQNQGLEAKASKAGFHYMSGHYTVHDIAVLPRVLGSVLVGTGIPFITSVPAYIKVVELSK